jgi:hypothetical protein
MWQSRRDLYRAVSVIFSGLSLAACFSILLFSWPDKSHGPVVARTEPPVSFGRAISADAEIVPAAFQTGTIRRNAHKD